MSRSSGRELRGAGLALVLAAAGAGTVDAAGVVGNGTPGSCTEAALNAALAGGGSVTFNCGGSPVVIPITSQKVVSVATTVDGGSADLVILDAGGVTRHFTTNQSTGTPIHLTIRNLTLRNGRCPVPDPGQPSPGYGGSIRSGIDSPLTIQDSRFLNNVCDVAGIDVGGGAIRQRRGALLVQRSLFQGNRAGNAGAISSSDSVATVEDSSFVSNTTNAHTTGFSGVGGGFYNDEAGNGLVTLRRTSFINNTATFAAGAVQSFFVPGDQGLLIQDCTFQGNSSPGDAGAVLAQLGPLTVTGSTFSGNSANNGAGIYINQGPSTITNSTFSGNTATNVGGGVFAGNSNVTYSYVTIAGNQANAAGGGISWGGGSATLRGSIVASNTGGGGQCSQALANGGFNVQFPGPATCAAGALVADPLLGALANNGGPTQTRAIGAASPARDLVTSGCPPPATDQRGVSRPAGACDAGAYELSGTLGIANASMAEGTGSNPTLNLTVTLSQASSQPVTVGFSTANGTAVAGADYVAATGTVTFPAGTTTRPIGITLVGDALDENDETFTVTLSNPVGAVLGTATATATITDDDAPPQVSIGDCTAPEGGGCGLQASLSAASAKPISVSYATASGTAASGTDFVASSGTLAFAPGATTALASVQTVQDSIDEVDETFVVNLTSPTNVTVADGQGTVFIDDNDGPRISAGDASVTEGNAGTTPLNFQVTLSATSPQEVRVDYQTSDGTATAGSDYVAATGTVTFPPGQTTRTVSVAVSGDGVDEPNERFHLNLINPADGSIGNPDGQATIVDDDGGVLRLRELGHGSVVRDTFAGGADVYLVSVPAFSSWEVVMDETSGDASSGG
ncbi:MAG TPA: Calx-beta domain-containing protein, partial [Vicinamibacteria bacterium]|nr:Calx-beta domain-containing protein [Vicinamibacteria bacterium]